MKRLRRLLQPCLFRYWLKTSSEPRTTRVLGLTLRVLPSVFHPRYFGSSAILAGFIAGLPLRHKRLLDMGTGTGIIGLAAARAGAEVTAVDLNPDAVRCAAENAAAAKLTMEVVESDLFSALAGRSFDVIVWNPPFFPGPAHSYAAAALYAGQQYETIERFADSARLHVLPAGRLFFILSEDCDIERIRAMFARAGFTTARAMERRWFGERMLILEAR